MTIVDTHCHLDAAQFDADRKAVIARAESAGVRTIVCPAISLDSARQVLGLASAYDGIYAAVGVHPNDCADFDDEMLAALRELAARPKVVAIGEIGLDYYWKRVPPETQKRALRAQLGLAAELGLPVILHSRESNADLLWEFAQWVGPIRKTRGSDAILGIWHAFSGDAAQAKEAHELGLLIGLGGPVTFQGPRTQQFHKLVSGLELDRLVLETDAPYLAPHPLRGRRNEPGYLSLIADRIAALHAISREALAERTTMTALRCFERIAYRYQGKQEAGC